MTPAQLPIVTAATHKSGRPAVRNAEFVEQLFAIIHEDDALLVVNKPAGLVCHPTKTDGYSSLIGRVRLYLGSGSQPQLINRLDRETSGLTVIAKQPDLARQLRRLWENRQVRKEYFAAVHGRLSREHGTIEAPLGKDQHSRVAIKDCVRADGAPASTEFWVERAFVKPAAQTGRDDSEADAGACRGSAADPAWYSLLRVVPHTGRKHQIRIHLAHLGHSIVGDKLYGVDEDLYLALVEDRLRGEDWGRLLLPHHALHAAELRFHLRGEEMVFRAEPEPWFKAFCCSEGLPA